MVELTRQEQELAVLIYRRYKSNPKTFVLSEDERTQAMRILDVTTFDIDGHLYVLYQGYLLGICLTSSDTSNYRRGEDSRKMSEVLDTVIFEKTKDMLKEIRKGFLSDPMIATALYIHMGVAHKIIPDIWDTYIKGNILSMAYIEVEKEEKQDGLVRN